MQETLAFKVWISKYALTEGIYETEVRFPNYDDKSGGKYVYTLGHFPILSQQFVKSRDSSEWHLTKEEAIQQAEKMRLKKIESLKKQITKLEKMRFDS